MIATWVCQASLSKTRARVLIVVSMEARIRRVIEASGRFALQLLDQSQRELVSRFALPFDGDRWAGVAASTTAAGLPLVEGGCGFVECVMHDSFATGDRVVYLGDVQEERVEKNRAPLHERDALTRQPDAVASALLRSYEIDVARDDRLLDVAASAPRDPEALMRLAIDKTREGLLRGQGPFGCAIARSGKLLAVEHNRVLSHNDMSAHAEITALRSASRRAGSHTLSGATVYTTCEPCPMCMTALHLADVEAVHFGATIADAERAGFRQIHLPAGELAALAGSRTRVAGGLLADACRALFDEWRSHRDDGRSPAY